MSGEQAGVTKAVLEVYEPRPQRTGGAALGSRLGDIEFHFNPKELSLAKAADWQADSSRGATSAPTPDFKGAKPATLSLEMFLDASFTRDGSVADTVQRLFECCVPTEQTTQRKLGTPPLVVFRWGTIDWVPSYVTAVTGKYTLFTSDGVPIRAVCTVQLQEMSAGKGRQNPTSGGLAVHRSHTLVAGETLATVAHREYGDPAKWRLLADANGIDDPMRVAPGCSLLVPAPDDAPRLAALDRRR